MQAQNRFDTLIEYAWQEYAKSSGLNRAASWKFAKAVIKQESGFNPRATSEAGARGLMQIMPGTWGNDGRYLPDVYNCEENINKGVRHLNYLYGMFKDEAGDERLKFVLGAYSAGQGSIIKCQLILKVKNRKTDSWQEIADTLPQVTGSSNSKQTVEYVQKIMAYYHAYTVTANV